MKNGYMEPSDFSDDELSSVLGLSQNASKQTKLEMQQRLATALRGERPAEGQSVPMGSTFLPPSPFTTAMQTFDHLQGIVSSVQGKKEGDQLDKERQTGLERFAKMWFNRNKQGDPTADPNQGPPSPQTQDPTDQNVPQQ